MAKIGMEHTCKNGYKMTFVVEENDIRKGSLAHMDCYWTPECPTGSVLQEVMPEYEEVRAEFCEYLAGLSKKDFVAFTDKGTGQTGIIR